MRPGKKDGSTMPPKLIRQMLASQIFSALTVSVCLLIDNIMINRFLGINAIAAYELSNPLLLSIGAVGGMLSAGIQVACSKSLGSGSQEETNKGYSTAVVFSLTVSFIFMVLVLAFRSLLARIVGAGTSGVIHDDTVGYLAGFSIGAPGSMFALILVPFLMMSGKNTLLIAAVVGMTVTDVAFDFLNVLVFHGGMFGMGLASALSYYVAVAIGLGYFLSKKSVFRFSFSRFSFAKTGELLRGGIPTAFNMASSIILVFFLNRMFMRSEGGGAAAVAAYAVASGIMNASNSISTGMSGVSLTLSGILFQEEDRNGLKNVLFLLLRWSVFIGLCVCIVLVIFAPFFVGLFLPEQNETQRMAILGVRLLASGLIPCCSANALKSFYQGTGRVLLTELFSFCEGAVFPCLAALLMHRLIGIDGLWLQFVIGEIITLSAVFLYTHLKARKVHDDFPFFMLLDPSFGVDKSELMEAEIRTMDDVSSVSQAAGLFCSRHGQSARFSNHIAVCVEEMAANTVAYGFSPGGGNHLSIRIQHKDDKWVLRFRDDCSGFDPVSYIPPEEQGKGMGIRLVTAMADDIRYTYSLNLNNLTVVLDGSKDRIPCEQ